VSLDVKALVAQLDGHIVELETELDRVRKARDFLAGSPIRDAVPNRVEAAVRRRLESEATTRLERKRARVPEENDEAEGDDAPSPAAQTQRDVIRAVMADGAEHTAADIMARSAERRTPVSKPSCEVYFAKAFANGEIERVAPGRYRTRGK
jgi:hypothetical protein